MCVFCGFFCAPLLADTLIQIHKPAVVLRFTAWWLYGSCRLFSAFPQRLLQPGSHARSQALSIFRSRWSQRRVCRALATSHCFLCTIRILLDYFPLSSSQASPCFKHCGKQGRDPVIVPVIFSPARFEMPLSLSRGPVVQVAVTIYMYAAAWASLKDGSDLISDFPCVTYLPIKLCVASLSKHIYSGISISHICFWRAHLQGNGHRA